MYRDANEAAERRIEELEDRLAEQATLIDELRTRLDPGDDYVEALSRKLDGRSRTPERMWRNTSIALLVALAFALVHAQGCAASPPAKTAEAPPPAPAPTLADPVPPRRAKALARKPSAETTGDCDPDDPLCESNPPNPAKAGLVVKMESGTATLDELRMLQALCMTDGDTDCRNAAYGAWKAKQDPPSGH